jgi:predicted Zn-dependent protease
MPVRRIFRYFLVIAAALGALYACAVNPVTGEREFVLMSEAQEIEFGRRADPEIRKEYGVYDDPKLQAYVQRLGEALAAHSHRPQLIYRFAVLDSDVVNAFALPGGYIYVTRGIMAYFNSEAELAAVLGHELGHVTARHAVRRYTAAVAASIGAGILGAVVPELGTQSGQQLLDVIGAALLAGYGRDQELEADRLGAQYLARAGYDPDAMIGVIALLKNQEEFEKARAKEEGREPRVYHGVFATHPQADKRLQEVIAEARKYKAPGAARTGREEYFKRLDGMVFGDSAREGVRHGRHFYHRDMNFALDFPEGWTLDNTPQAVLARPRDRSALMELQTRDLHKRITPREYMVQQLKLTGLSREGPLAGSELPSHTAVVRINTPFGTRDTRVIVVYYGNRAFVFLGAAKAPEAFDGLDPLFLATARSLRPLDDKERRLAEGLRLRLHRAALGETFAALARKSPISAYPEMVLRLFNDKFPSGEPAPGELIKIVE